MSGLGIRLCTDEEVDPELAVQLSRLGYDALSCHAAANHDQGLNDDWQLRYAASEQRAILVYNIAHFVALDRDWRARAAEHHGIILSQQLRIGELVRRARRHLDTYTPQQQYNTVLQLAR